MAKVGMSAMKIAGAVLLTLVVASLSWGQMPDIPDKGFRPFGSYQLSDIDSVNLTNGNLIVHVPIVSYPQRGNMPPLSLSVRYNNPRWAIKFQYKGQQQFTGLDYWWAWWGDDGATTEIVRDDTYSVAAYVYNAYSIDPGPGSEALHVVDSMGAHHFVANTSGDLTHGFGNTMESMDGTGLKVEGNASYINPTIIDGNGIRHIMAGINQVDHPVRPDLGGDEERIAYQISTANGFAESTEDTNGNKITTVPGGWKDTMDRFIPAPNQFKTGCETLNFPGTNGGTAPITFCYGGTAIHSTFGLTSVIDGNYHDENYPLLQVISSITLPNGTSWQFHYDNYGFLSSIDLPTGGTISYTWQVSQACANFLQNERNLGGSFVWGNTGTVVCDFFVTSRTFDAHDGSGPHTWTYSGDTSSNSSGRVTVTDPLGNDTVHTYAAYNSFSPNYEIKTQYYNGPQANNQVLKTVDRQYQNTNAACNSDEGLADNMGPSPAIVPLSTTTTWAATNRVSQSTFTYDSGASVFVSDYASVQTCPLTYGKVIQESEYGYGTGAPGPLLRTTNTQYQWQVDSNYLQRNLLDLPHSVQVTDGSGNQVAYSYDEYDQTGLQPSGVSTQFDTNPPGVPYRGNLTAAHHWLNTTRGYLNTTTSYYDTGMPYQETDAKGNPTTLSYDSSGAYVTKVQMPTTSNGVQHVTYAAYDFNTGLKTSSTDQNGTSAGDLAHTTTYTYDNMGRVKSVTGPPEPSNGGQSSQTIYNYYDLPNVSLPEVEVRQNIDGRLTDSLTLFDGLGRATRTVTWNDEDPNNPYDQVDTCFDGLGQKYFTSYPYRSTGFNTTKACSNSQEPGETFSHDALGRVTQVTHADNNFVSTDYSQFPTTTVTDEAGNSRRNRTDALGRLLEVDEPGGSPASTASGSLIINGTLQSFAAGPQQATSGHVELTFSGTLQSKSSCSPSGQPCSDSGSISITVAGFSKSASYPYPGYLGSDSSATIQALANAFHSDTSSPVDAIYYGADESGNIVMDLVARAKGAATNYPLSTAIVSSDSTDFPSPSFQVSAGSHLIGGQDASGPATSGHASLSFSGALLSKANCSSSGGQPCSDSGSLSTTVTTSAGPYSKSVAYSSATGNNSSQAVQALANAFHNDANSPVNAFFTTDESGNFILYLTARATGAATNYALSASVASNDQADFPSPSFQVNAPSSLTGGQDATNAGTIYDSGVVYLSAGTFTASAPFGQGSNSTAAMLATALVSGLNASGSPVTATASGSTIAMTYKTVGAAGNVGASVTSSSYNPDSPSFSSAGTTLGGGANAVAPSFSTPAVTLYSYDTLDNLVGVQQQGGVADSMQWRQRSFAYDSLGRLLTATNPESGTISYVYDANGNLTSKTSPAPNVPLASTATQTISYCYDELNRLKGEAYAAQSCPLSSPVVSYAYDAGSNGIGHVTSVADHAGSGSYSYDVMGRMSAEQRTIAGVSKSFSYAYNLDGSLKSITYPSRRVVTYSYNSAQRPASATDNNGNNFATAAHYTPFGALSTVLNGGITTNHYYNLRMQPCRLATSSAGVVSSTTPCTDTNNLGNVLDLGYDFVSCNSNGGNNGNVCQLINHKNSARTQQFGYDALNRLAWAWTPNTTSPSLYWGQNYGYDNWGNLLQKNVAGGDTSLNVKANGKNQVT